MKLELHNNRDFWAGLMFFAIGITAIFIAREYPFGSTLQAIRDNAQRCEAVGINVKRINSNEIAKAYQEQLLGGILWALGLQPGSAALAK
jgi:ABC-type xylose transport system permease subunit